ncbi:cobaltochelatase CobT-related protein [Ruegeria sp. MALMAid1280]|uniref:cobaltochelatase CobT-related protein n=1 Tax=Ruegeria sp. MALMAid1280 TaxID=3411634 RepID=UPI003B9EA6EE
MTEDVRSTIQKRDDKGVVRHGGEWLTIWSDPDSLKSESEKREEANRDQALRDIEASLAATARSMVGRDVEVRFGPAAGADTNCIVLPKLEPDAANLVALRGQCDASASFMVHHNPDLHLTLSPKDSTRARLFLLLEHLRCEALEASAFPGVVNNLVALQVDRLKRAQLLHAHLASLLPLAEALRMVCRDSFLGAPEPSLQTAGFRMWDRWLRERYQKQLTKMASVIGDQRAFAEQSKSFLAALLAELPSAGERQRRALTDQDNDSGTDSSERRLSDDPADAPLFEPGEVENDFNDLPHPVSASPSVNPRPYRVFTTQHDRVVHANDLAPSASLREARLRLDARMSEYRAEVTRLVSRLQRRILAQQTRQWEFDLEEGLIDAAKLDRVVINPGFEHAYKQETDSPFRDTVVTLLIDNSGSMRGKQVETACVVAELLAAALERCAISTEILGFTTSAWKGGRSYKDWLRAGKPAEPGRLNDVLHIIYKDAATPLRRARDSICAMLSPSILKENIDGEALEWAAVRLLQRPEQRKILIVLSDGAPVDQATLERNEDKAILDRHLHEVIAHVGTNSSVQLCAIGIRHDVSAHYPISRRVDRVEDLADVVVDLLDQLLQPGRPKG